MVKIYKAASSVYVIRLFNMSDNLSSVQKKTSRLIHYQDLEKLKGACQII